MPGVCLWGLSGAFFIAWRPFHAQQAQRNRLLLYLRVCLYAILRFIHHLWRQHTGNDVFRDPSGEFHQRHTDGPAIFAACGRVPSLSGHLLSRIPVGLVGRRRINLARSLIENVFSAYRTTGRRKPFSSCGSALAIARLLRQVGFCSELKGSYDLLNRRKSSSKDRGAASIADRFLHYFFVRSDLTVTNKDYPVRVLRDVHFVSHQNNGISLPM